MKYCLILMLCVAALCGCHKDSTKVKDVPKTIDTPVVTVSLSIPADSIILNPSGNAPLSALLHFKSTITGHSKIVVKGKNGPSSDISQTFTDNSKTHAIPVLGLYPAYKNTVEVSVTDANKKVINTTISITTGALPVNVPNYINVDVADRANMQSGVNLVSSFSGFGTPPQVPYILDSYGDIRWYLDFTKHPTLNMLFYDCGISRLKNGNFYFADQPSGKIYEVDIMGKIVNTWSLGGYTFHHNVTEKPNGNFLISVIKSGSTHTDGSATIEDYIIELNRSTGDIINTWDLKESLDEYRTTLNNDPVDWIHVNAVIYDASDNSIIISGRVQGVVKLTNDNHVKWILAPHRGWGKNRRGEDLNKFLLTPLDATGKAITGIYVLEGVNYTDDFEWNWYQHSPIIIPNGDLMLFDNGAIRGYNNTLPNHYSRAVEYKIDATKMTVQQKWEYGRDRAEQTFSSIVSSVKYLEATKHVLFSPGFSVPNAVGAGGKIVEIDYATKKVVFELSASSENSWGWHRVERLELYPNANPYK